MTEREVRGIDVHDVVATIARVDHSGAACVIRARIAVGIIIGAPNDQDRHNRRHQERIQHRTPHNANVPNVAVAHATAPRRGATPGLMGMHPATLTENLWHMRELGRATSLEWAHWYSARLIAAGGIPLFTP